MRAHTLDCTLHTPHTALFSQHSSLFSCTRAARHTHTLETLSTCAATGVHTLTARVGLRHVRRRAQHVQHVRSRRPRCPTPCVVVQPLRPALVIRSTAACPTSAASLIARRIAARLALGAMCTALREGPVRLHGPGRVDVNYSVKGTSKMNSLHE